MTEKYILVGRETVAEPDVLKWGVWYEKHERTVAYTYVGVAEVSTVFLGVDHSHGQGPPLLFETMVFGGEHDQFQRRYCTYAEAEAGHAEVVQLLNPLAHVVQMSKEISDGRQHPEV